MRFPLPHNTQDFEIPDAWWSEAGMSSFTPTAATYRASSDPQWPTMAVHILQVAPPNRAPGVPSFAKERMVDVLRAIRESSPMPPIEVDEPEWDSIFRYRVRDGYHRFYAS